MAILSKIRMLPQMRFELEDLNALLSFLCADHKAQINQFWSNQAYILNGFNVINTVGSSSPLQMTLNEATLINANNSGSFSWFVGPSGAANLEVTLTASTRNFIEIELGTETGTPITKSFWDPSAASGAGQEFSQTVDTVTNLNVTAITRTGGFSGLDSRLPIAVIDTDASNNIQLILDRREMFWRLGQAADPEFNYAWLSQSEPTLTLNLSSVVGSYTVHEIVNFSSGATAEVVSGGSGSSIEVILLDSLSLTQGDTVTGASSGATATLTTASESFDGADKDIRDFKEFLNAVQTELKAVKGTRFWFEPSPGSLSGIFSFFNTLIAPDASASNASYNWDGSDLTISDGNGSPNDSDVLAKIRRLTSTTFPQELDLTRQDGTGGSTTIPLADQELVFIKIPSSGDRTWSGIGTGDTNYQIVDRSAFIENDENYWLAYREGTRIIARGIGELETGEGQEISDQISTTLLSNIGLPSENAAPVYTSNIRGVANESLVARLGASTDALGDEQEDRSSLWIGGGIISWSGSIVSWSAVPAINFILFNVKTGGTVLHSYPVSSGDTPLTLNANEKAWLSIDRTDNGALPASLTVGTQMPAQTQSEKDNIVLFIRIGTDLYIPWTGQILAAGQSAVLGNAPAPAVIANDKLEAIYDAIVGSVAQVSAGVATYSTIQAAIGAVTAGGRILVLDNTFTETITVNKEVHIEGKGRASILNGTLTFNSSGALSSWRRMKIQDNIVFDSGADNIFLTHCWISSGVSITGAVGSNEVLLIEE